MPTLYDILKVSLSPDNVRVLYPEELVLEKRGVDFEVVVCLGSVSMSGAGLATGRFVGVVAVAPERVILVVDLELGMEALAEVGGEERDEAVGRALLVVGPGPAEFLDLRRETGRFH